MLANAKPKNSTDSKITDLTWTILHCDMACVFYEADAHLLENNLDYKYFKLKLNAMIINHITFEFLCLLEGSKQAIHGKIALVSGEVSD